MCNSALFGNCVTESKLVMSVCSNASVHVPCSCSARWLQYILLLFLEHRYLSHLCHAGALIHVFPPTHPHTLSAPPLPLFEIVSCMLRAVRNISVLQSPGLPSRPPCGR